MLSLTLTLSISPFPTVYLYLALSHHHALSSLSHIPLLLLSPCFHHQLLDEFADVTQSEKQFIKLWNGYLKKDPPYSDYFFSEICRRFSADVGNQICEKKLRWPFLLHLLTMWEFNLVSMKVVEECMSMIDATIAGDDE